MYLYYINISSCLNTNAKSFARVTNQMSKIIMVIINNFESNKTDSAKDASSAAYKANCGKWLIGN